MMTRRALLLSAACARTALGKPRIQPKDAILDPNRLTKFVDALPIPPRAVPSGTHDFGARAPIRCTRRIPFYRLTMQEFDDPVSSRLAGDARCLGLRMRVRRGRRSRRAADSRSRSSGSTHCRRRICSRSIIHCMARERMFPMCGRLCTCMAPVCPRRATAIRRTGIRRESRGSDRIPIGRTRPRCGTTITRCRSHVSISMRGCSGLASDPRRSRGCAEAAGRRFRNPADVV